MRKSTLKSHSLSFHVTHSVSQLAVNAMFTSSSRVTHNLRFQRVPWIPVCRIPKLTLLLCAISLVIFTRMTPEITHGCVQNVELDFEPQRDPLDLCFALGLRSEFGLQIEGLLGKFLCCTFP